MNKLHVEGFTTVFNYSTISHYTAKPKVINISTNIATLTKSFSTTPVSLVLKEKQTTKINNTQYPDNLTLYDDCMQQVQCMIPAFT